ncbi:MAG: hypothetical protein AAB533_03980 [Patescibacteria group bacterium]
MILARACSNLHASAGAYRYKKRLLNAAFPAAQTPRRMSVYVRGLRQNPNFRDLILHLPISSS